MTNLSDEKGKLVWPDLIKMTALIWIFINHLAEAYFSYPYIANPSANWPPLAVRIAQLNPLTGFGLWDLPFNIWRYVGWFGDQGVQLFLIVSGFGLTWSLLSRHGKDPFKISDFYLRRVERIFPLWWAAHFLFIGLFLLTGSGLSPFSLKTILSILGLRMLPGLLYYFSPAWWYIALIIQLYLIFPVLWYALRRWGPCRLFLVSSLCAFLIRLAGLYFFENHLDAWSRGSIFVTRLPEFVFGICFAVWLFESPGEVARRLKGPLTWPVLVSAYFFGNLISLTLSGMAVAPFLTGSSAFLILYRSFDKFAAVAPRSAITPLVWVGKHSYSLFLVHHPVVLALITPEITSPYQIIFRIVLAVGLTVLLGLIIEEIAKFFGKMLASLTGLFWTKKTAVGLAVSGSMVGGLLFGAELAVRRFDPQEISGWGERESLQPNADFGWHLIPSQTTHLRWDSYDYFVNANSLGFSGPEPRAIKSPGTYRIMVTGDAYSSAEGVNTEQAWPRLLESRLSAKQGGNKVEVLNFAITGHGPNQYHAVVAKFAPLYKPDLIIMEVFVNDFQDALISNDEFRNSIGFDQTRQANIKSLLGLRHLRRWLNLNLFEPLMETIIRRPRSHGYFLGNFRALERGHSEYENDGKEIFASRLQATKAIAGQDGTQLIIVMVPAPAQVCDESQLSYFPKVVDLSDGTTFDVDLPQKLMAELATRFDLRFYDLRDVFIKGSPECPYQPRNMHWTEAGHQKAADYIANFLLRDGYIH